MKLNTSFENSKFNYDVISEQPKYYLFLRKLLFKRAPNHYTDTKMIEYVPFKCSTYTDCMKDPVYQCEVKIDSKGLMVSNPKGVI